MNEGMRSRGDEEEDERDGHDQRDRALRELEVMQDEIFWKRVYLAAVSTCQPNPAGAADEALQKVKERRARNWSTPASE